MHFLFGEFLLGVGYFGGLGPEAAYFHSPFGLGAELSGNAQGVNNAPPVLRGKIAISVFLANIRGCLMARVRSEMAGEMTTRTKVLAAQLNEIKQIDKERVTETKFFGLTLTGAG